MRSSELFLASTLALSGLAVGCGDNNPAPADAYTPSTTDTGMTTGNDAGGGTTQAPVAIGSSMASMPANFACLGTNTAPTAGAPISANVKVLAISLSDIPVINSPIAFFPGTEVRGTCDGDCVMAMTDGMGVANTTLPAGGWFGYRLAAGGTSPNAWVPSIAYFYTFPTTADDTTNVYAISTTAATLVANGLNRELTTESSAVSGSVNDCDGENVANVAIRMFRGDTEICPGGCPADDITMPRITGLTDSPIPARSADGLTRYAGRFAGIVPSAGGAVRIEAYGVLEAGGEPTLIGCEEVLVEGNTVTIAVVPPLRDDYAASSGCAGRM